MVDSETRVRAEREMVLKSVLDAGRGQRSDPTLNMVRGNVKVSLEHRGDIDWDAPEIQRRLNQAGAFDKPRAEGFLVGLMVASTVSMEGLYPKTYDVDVDAGEMARELAGTETAEKAVAWIHDEYSWGHAHVSYQGPDEANPFIFDSVRENMPPGWTEAEDPEYDSYLVKE